MRAYMVGLHGVCMSVCLYVCMYVGMYVCPSRTKAQEPLHIQSQYLVCRCIIGCRCDFVQAKVIVPKICK